MEEENIYDRIEDIIGHFPQNLNILEEQIDIDLQMEYFEFSWNIKKDGVPVKILSMCSKLFDKDNSIENKRRLLVQLASIEKVEAYRSIEKYLADPDKELKDWAILAYQESRMVLQSKLLDENQVFISTGLGGKGSSLRYFVVLINSSDIPFDSLQQRIIRNEFDFYLKKNEAELEEVNFTGHFCSLLVIVPIKTSIRDVLTAAVDECNEYGGFIRQNFLVTNVKKLTFEEINDFITRQEDKDHNNKDKHK